MRDILKTLDDSSEAAHRRIIASIREWQKRNPLLVLGDNTEPTCTNGRLDMRIANASKLRDGGEMFLDLAECER